MCPNRGISWAKEIWTARKSFVSAALRTAQMAPNDPRDFRMRLEKGRCSERGKRHLQKPKPADTMADHPSINGATVDGVVHALSTATVLQQPRRGGQRVDNPRSSMSVHGDFVLTARRSRAAAQHPRNHLARTMFLRGGCRSLVGTSMWGTAVRSTYRSAPSAGFPCRAWWFRTRSTPCSRLRCPLRPRRMSTKSRWDEGARARGWATQRNRHDKPSPEVLPGS